ncbi:MAG: flavodoxin family protein [Pygmaiobacter massiliensis]|nr:flavodoxin family protein [Pygmaiobacter massiliensis]
MKVLMLNGSPHSAGCTYTALRHMADRFEQNEVECEIFQLGAKPVAGCTGCGACVKLGRCVQQDLVAELSDKLAAADGFVVGSPVYFASANGSLIAALDRLFYCRRERFAHKPAAAVVSARRAGTTVTMDELNKYFSISRMPIVSSQYWNMVHGNTPAEVLQDKEGLQILRTLADEMTWLMRLIEAGRSAHILPPEPEAKISTNFIR